MKFNKSTVLILCALWIVFLPLEVVGTDILSYGMKAQEHMNKQEYDKALMYLQKATKVNPNNTWIRGMMASSLYQQGRFSESQKEYEFIAQLEPDNDTAATMITVLEPLITMQKSKSQKASGNLVSKKILQPKDTKVLTSQDGHLTCVSHTYNFQLSLPAGTWQCSDNTKGGKYKLKCHRKSPAPQLMVQLAMKELDTTVVNENQEKAIVKEYGQSIQNLVCKQAFQKKMIRTYRMYWGIYETTIQTEIRPITWRYQWLIAMKGKRFYTLTYSHPRGLDDDHQKIYNYIFWNFAPFENVQ